MQTRESRASMIMQVHDELVFEVDDADVDALVDGVVQHMGAAADSMCRWSSMSAAAATGTKRIDARRG